MTTSVRRTDTDPAPTVSTSGGCDARSVAPGASKTAASSKPFPHKAHAAAKVQPAPIDPQVDRIRLALEQSRRMDPPADPPPGFEGDLLFAGAWPEPHSVPVSVLIPVKNEAKHIVECIRRLRWARQIAIVDSAPGSTDGTIELAQSMGAEVYQFSLSRAGWPKKKNWAIENLPWRHPWLLIMDADEYMTPALAREIAAIVAGRAQPKRVGCGDGYWINRRFMFMGRWIRGCGYYPSWNVRLFRPEVGRYERIGSLGDTGSGDNEVHEHVVLSTGEAGYLEHDFMHYAYPDIAAWVEKHNRYSSWEAHAFAAGFEQGGVKGSLSGGPIARRRWLKAKTARIPLRPLARFLYAYVLQRGFLDGRAGWTFCRLLAWYEFMITSKAKELQIDARPPGYGVPPELEVLSESAPSTLSSSAAQRGADQGQGASS